MADLDSATPLKPQSGTAVVINDGTSPSALTLTAIFQGNFNWTVNGKPGVESLNQNTHKSTPVVTEVGDTTVSLTMEGTITSLKGSSNTHVYEALTRTGNASAWVPTNDGDDYCVEIVFTVLESKNSGAASQTITFAYCKLESIQVTANVDNVLTFSASFTDYENAPTIA